MLVTIIADASHCPDTHAAGFAYWIKCERGKLFGSGRAKEPVGSSVIAEMMALVNGVCFGLKDGVIASGDMLCMQTDCIPAIQKLYGSSSPSSSGERMVAGYFQDLTKKANLRFYFKHVRGHTKVRDGRSKINRYCDDKAKHHMRRMRGTLKIKALRETLV